MVFVLVALAVYKVTQVARFFVEAPIWVIIVFTTAISAAGLWVAGESPAWCLAVAALAGGVHRLDGLLQALTDWVRVSVLQRRR